MSLVHGATDGAILLAASSRLVKSARRWYEIQTRAAMESWIGFRQDLMKTFERKMLYKAMQKIEARKWAQGKETFDQYAIDKVALMHRLDLSIKDTINLVIGGITQSLLRTVALSIRAETLEEFLETMRQITEGITDIEKRRPGTGNASTATSTGAPRDVYRNCGKKGHTHQECRGETSCFYCKEKGHRRYDCSVLRRKGATPKTTTPGASTTALPAANVSVEASSARAVAAVNEVETKIEVANPFVKINSLNNKECNLVALIDTGSPVSFVKSSV